MPKELGGTRGGRRACERERATREEAAGVPFCRRHRHTVTVSLPSPFTI